MKAFIYTATLACFAAPQVMAQHSWYLKPQLGISNISDQSGNAVNAGVFDGDWQSGTDSGFTAGLGLGYQYSQGVSAELFWEYRSNDSNTTIKNTDQSFDGNYAANLIMVNGYYHFLSNGSWRPFLGAGLVWAQEIDIDLESDGTEQSYSGDGDFGWQIALGTSYQLTPRWQLNAELRYTSLSSLELQGEEGATGKLSGFDYQPKTLAIGFQYHF